MPIVDVKSLMLTSRRTEVLGALFGEGKTLKFGDFLDQVKDEPSYVAAFNSFTVQEFLDHAASLTATVPGKTPKVTVNVPAIENFKDQAVQDAWKAKVVEVLTAVGVGEGRGISPQKIRVTIGSGNEAQGRDLMTEMETAGILHATSKARGKKYVLAQFAAQADAAWAKEQAEAKAEADAKAVAAADKAKAPATPAADAKAPKAPKAPKA